MKKRWFLFLLCLCLGIGTILYAQTHPLLFSDVTNTTDPDTLPDGDPIRCVKRGTFTYPEQPIVDETLSEEGKALVQTIFTDIVSGTDDLQTYLFANNNWDEARRIENCLTQTFDDISYIFDSLSQCDKNGILHEDHSKNTHLKITIRPSDIRKDYEQQFETLTYANEALQKAGITDGISEKDAIRKMVDWICEQMTYEDEGGSAIHGFTTGTGNCNTYTLMVQDMCHEMNIPCDYISGTADGGPHAWNRLKLNGTWYYLDTCWMDVTNDTYRMYYLAETLWSDHVADNR